MPEQHKGKFVCFLFIHANGTPILEQFKLRRNLLDEPNSKKISKTNS